MSLHARSSKSLSSSQAGRPKNDGNSCQVACSSASLLWRTSSRHASHMDGPCRRDKNFGQSISKAIFASLSKRAKSFPCKSRRRRPHACGSGQFAGSGDGSARPIRMHFMDAASSFARPPSRVHRLCMLADSSRGTRGAPEVRESCDCYKSNGSKCANSFTRTTLVVSAIRK